MTTKWMVRGQTLVMATVIAAVLTIVGGAFLNRSMSGMNVGHLQRLYTEAFYLAQGGVEDAIGQFATALANFQASATAPQYPTSGTLTATFSPTASLPAGATTSAVLTELEPGQQVVTDPDGTTVFVKVYRVTATAPHPLNPAVTLTLNQIITRRLIATFQHAIFYAGDLEWLPGPTMTLTGRVHGNSDIYIDANNLLTVDNEYLHSAGNIYNRRKDTGATMPGEVQIRKAGTGAFVAMAGFDSSDPTWATGSQTTWNGTVQTGVHGVTQLAVPVVGSIAPGGYYDTNAGLQVTGNGSSITITKNGVALNQGADLPAGTVTVTNTLYNFREGTWIQTLNIDLKKLAGYNSPSDPAPTFPNQLPVNGLLYATASNTGTSQPAVRLQSGSEIYRTGGLTVVTNDPMYVQGDFNTINKQPCAVIGDAANLLSNNWNDANSSNPSLSARTAGDTSVNLAFIAGIKSTSGAQYSGGLENYPRLLEKWDGKTLSITGSFVSLWDSAIATGNWAYGSPSYTAPTRNWDYDTDFSSGNLPPFTPMAIEIQRGAWWKE